MNHPFLIVPVLASKQEGLSILPQEQIQPLADVVLTILLGPRQPPACPPVVCSFRRRSLEGRGRRESTGWQRCVLLHSPPCPVQSSCRLPLVQSRSGLLNQK